MAGYKLVDTGRRSFLEVFCSRATERGLTLEIKSIRHSEFISPKESFGQDLFKE